MKIKRFLPGKAVFFINTQNYSLQNISKGDLGSKQYFQIIPGHRSITHYMFVNSYFSSENKIKQSCLLFPGRLIFRKAISDAAIS
jgi:hypothetical protein